MSSCKDCIHDMACGEVDVFRLAIMHNSKAEKYCKNFKNKANFIELPYKPFPVVLSEDENNSDVFCPFCDTDLSGHYYGGDYESPKIVPCFECGTWLDGTKTITKEEAKRTIVKRSYF